MGLQLALSSPALRLLQLKAEPSWIPSLVWTIAKTLLCAILFCIAVKRLIASDSKLPRIQDSPPVPISCEPGTSLSTKPDLPNALSSPTSSALVHTKNPRGEAKKQLSWIQDCLQSHSICNHKQRQESARSFLPTRLVDVQQPSHVHLVISDDVVDPDWGYAALSYCWGDSMPESGRTTRSSLAARLQYIDAEQLPKTLREAVEVTRSLSIKYLWIDALCIIQDDEVDREHEIETMSEVYSCATVTIAAGVSTHCDGGFLVENRPPLRFTNSPIKYHPENASVRTCPWVSTFCSNPLFQRGWTLQERELSPRVLHFTSIEVVFECRQSIKRYELAATEAGSEPVEQNYLFFAEPDGWPHRILDLQDSRKKFLRTVALSKIDSLDWHVVWWRTVEEYSRRQFTIPNDRLRAIAGLADTLQKKFKWDYFSGLWAGNLALDLLWTVHYDKEFDLAEPCMAPSWSWASVGCPISYGAKEFSPFDKTVLDIVGIGTQPWWWNMQTGSAYLRVRGRIKQTSVAAVAYPGHDICPIQRIIYDVPGNGELIIYWDRVISIVAKEEVAILLVVHNDLRAQEGTGLILRKTGTDGAYRRLGLAKYTGNFMQDAKSEMVIII
jgi:hypothetical protein